MRWVAIFERYVSFLLIEIDSFISCSVGMPGFGDACEVRRNFQMKKVLAAKLHGIHVTEANLHYHGSITLDPDQCHEAGILPMEFVEIWNKNSGARISTYVIFGEPGSRLLCPQWCRRAHLPRRRPDHRLQFDVRGWGGNRSAETKNSRLRSRQPHYRSHDLFRHSGWCRALLLRNPGRGRRRQDHTTSCRRIELMSVLR
ncbi:hypothetical protein ACVWZV_004402 [Bradyrhizobium sp. GM5.1]